MSYFVRTYELWRSERQRVNNQWEIVWVKQGDIPGRVYPTSSANRNAAAQDIGVITWVFACAASTGIKTGDEVRFDGRKLTVQAIPVTSRGDRIEALCQEVQQ